MINGFPSRYINLLTDFGFKRIFGTEANKAFLIDFLNSLLPSIHQIQDLTFKNTENLGYTEIDRRAIFDLYCQSTTGEQFIVELQKAKQRFFKDRSLYYATFPIQEQSIQGNEWNYSVSPVYVVGILDFCLEEHQDDPNYWHTVTLKDEKGQVFCDKLNLVYLELPKFTKSPEALESQLEKWVYLFKNLSILDEPPSNLHQDNLFGEFFETAEIANFSQAEQEKYRSNLKYHWDWYSVFETFEYSLQEAEAEGREEGLAKGREEGRIEEKRTVARRMKELGLSTAEIAACTGLSEAEIAAL